MLDRRQALLGLGAAGLASPALAESKIQPLKSLAAGKGLVFGSAVGAGPKGSLTGSFEDAHYRAILADECGVLVPENELKWYVLRPAEKTFAFERADRIAAFAAEHGAALRGHTLLWHHPQWFPAWLKDYDFGSRPAARVEAMLAEHVDRVCAHYPQIYSWDVVNETVDPADGALRRTVFSDAMGGVEPVLDASFHLARKAAPKARLVYNDYMSWEAGNEKHRHGVLKLLEGFRKRNVPVDALGIQSHIGAENADSFTGFGRPQEKEWRAFVDEAVGMGYDLALTEFDVHDKGLPVDFAARDAAVAAYGKAYLDLMLSYRQTKELLAWGMVDKYSWLQNQWLRQDKAPKRPTLYDDAYAPKPLREAVAQALRDAPAR
ncbi:glycosyl hydrolase [Caulobacter flavus]|uniref:Beta-xylanase n=1 Tax=Caulobacter flavus TaxID=1679497 RepID=A0A2N5CUS7_9CAUL|nr:endo-1,4-beta-xylanase [Caulobacter flavus]AYV45021.1 glycosyl hydrolase [Caulobacter flavus]PLR17289.1 glycosyl hydrolase [Caulobacter flavus]